jgi:putative endonuclease
MVWLIEYVVRTLQKLARNRRESSHLKLGRQGEAETYFYLRRLGYRIIASNFRAPRDRGEIDLIGWDGDVLCFIEVKTRTDDSFAPPSTAVTKEKQKHILSVAKSYLRRMPGGARPACRFDVVSVVPSASGQPMEITLRKGAFSWNTGRRREADYGERFAGRFSRASRNGRKLPR